jgi:hypothetical protein
VAKVTWVLKSVRTPEYAVNTSVLCNTKEISDLNYLASNKGTATAI